MHVRESIDRLDFHNDRACNHDIESISGIEAKTLVLHGQVQLTLELHAAAYQLVDKARFIRRLQKTGPKVAMYFDRGRDDALRDGLV